MPWWMPLATAGIGAAGSVIASSNQPKTVTNSTMTDGRNWNQTTPHPAAMPGLGMLAAGMQEMGGSPQPFYPGLTYAGPSAPTQEGVNMAMGGMPYYNAAANQSNVAGDAYAGMTPLYAGAQQAWRNTSPLYDQAISAYQNLPGQYGQALGNWNHAADFLNRTAGHQANVGKQATRAYGRHLNAGDVASNPYVQAMHGQTANDLATQFKEQLLPAITRVGSRSMPLVGVATVWRRLSGWARARMPWRGP